MTSARSPEQRARLSRESGLDLNRFDSVIHLEEAFGTRPNAGLPEYGIPAHGSCDMPIHNAYVALLRVERSARLIRARRAIRPIADVWVIG